VNLIAGFEAWSEIELLTGTIYGEASGETTAGKIGVGMTIRTRALNPCWWGHNWREVILLDKQFTCWADHNRARIRKGLADQDPAWKICSRVARDIYAGNIVDKIGGPTNYHEEGILPRWTRKMKRLAHIGAHIFYRDLTVQIKVMP
jgi:spore germination cell wall hydrolase CwlJ-like protein